MSSDGSNTARSATEQRIHDLIRDHDELESEVTLDGAPALTVDHLRLKNTKAHLESLMDNMEQQSERRARLLRELASTDSEFEHVRELALCFVYR